MALSELVFGPGGRNIGKGPRPGVPARPGDVLGLQVEPDDVQDRVLVGKDSLFPVRRELEGGVDLDRPAVQRPDALFVRAEDQEEAPGSL